MRTLFRTITMLGAATALTAAAAAASAQTTVLRYSNWLPDGNVLRVRAVEPWAAEVERVTEGRVRIETLPKVVGTVNGQFDAARDGQADLVVFSNGYTPGRFNILDVVTLPFMGDDPEVFSPLVYRFYTKHLTQYGEYKGVVPLSIFVSSPGQFFNSKRAVRTLEDFKGLKIRTPSPSATKALTALGVVPVTKPVSETYELLSGGILDGTLMPPESIGSFKLTDRVPYATIIPGALFNSVLTLAINEAKWNSLSKTDRDAIMKISGEPFSRTVGLAYKRGDEVTWEAFRRHKFTIDTLSPAVVAEMKTLLKPVEASWIEQAKKRGVEQPEKLLESLRAEIAAATPASTR